MDKTKRCNLVLISFLLITSIKCSIDFHFNQGKEQAYKIHICIGEKDNCFPFMISLLTNEILVFSSNFIKGGYNSGLSESSFFMDNDSSTFYKDDLVNGKYGFDRFFIKGTNVTLSLIKFFLVEGGLPIPDGYFGIIGLNFDAKNSENETTLLSFLIMDQYIQDNLFTIGKFKLSLGNENIAKSLGKIHKKCRILKKSRLFELPSCQVNSVVYSRYKSSVFSDISDAYIFFDVTVDWIVSPSNFYKLLMIEVFEPYIATHLCTSNEIRHEYSQITCENQAIQEMKNDLIYFFISNWNLKYKISDLFINSKFQIVSQERQNDWIFGRFYLDDNIITVDKNSHSIYFHN